VTRGRDELDRVTRRLGVISTERARAVEEQERTEQRREESVAAIVAHEARKVTAETSLGEVLSRLQQGRESAVTAMLEVAAARAEQAALVERVAGLSAEVARLVPRLGWAEPALCFRRQVSVFALPQWRWPD